MTQKPQKIQADKLKLSDTPTVFSDHVNIACRMDGGLLLQFIAETPDILVENFRTIMVKDSAITFLENLALALGHYPIEKKPTRQKKTVAGIKASK